MRYLRMLCNSMAAAALATAYVIALVLHLNPNLPLHPTRLMPLVATVGLFYVIHLTVIFYILLVLRQLLARVRTTLKAKHSLDRALDVAEKRSGSVARGGVLACGRCGARSRRRGWRPCGEAPATSGSTGRSPSPTSPARLPTAAASRRGSAQC